MSVLIGLSPFIVFFVLMRLVSPVAGLTGALTTSALLGLRMWRRRESIKILEVGSFVQRLLAEDAPVLDTIRFRPRNLVASDRHLARFFKYVREFPRAIPPGA